MLANAVVPGDGNRNLRKQIGCMNGIFQIFDRQHRHKRLLFGGQHQLEEPHDAANALTDQEIEVLKQKPRISTESSQVSNSSSSCSSTFSSLEHVRTNISESPLHTIDKKENGPTMSTGPRSPHIRNVVKDSMHREARGVPIKSFKTNNEQKVTVMKHVDSPRPIQKPKSEKPKARSHEEPNRTFPRNERLIHRRLSFDGRESRDGLKTKHRELPRLSLDSKPSSIKCSGPDLRSDILGQESGGHSRTSSIVAKLMGLDDFPNVITTYETNVTATNSIINILPDPSKATKENKEKQISFLKPPRSSRLPMEPAPWKQKDYSQDSPKIAAQSRKGPKSTQNSPFSSVYAEMEKRITELEFKRSGKDLRALKQILEAMQKTRDKLEKERRGSTELQNENNLLCSSNRVTKPPNVMEKMQMQSQAVYPVRGEKAKEPRPKNVDKKGPRRCFSSMDKKTTSRNSELKQTIRAPQRTRLDNYGADPSYFEMASPKLQQTALPSSGRAQKHSGKKVGELHSLSENAKLKSTGFIRHSFQGDTAFIESESSNSLASHLDTEASSLAISTNLNCREKQKSPTSKEHMPAVELSVTLMEQPSPVSVLDAAFYIEESPSPVKKISKVFQGPDEVEWPLENLSHFTDKYNQKQRDTSELMHIPTISKTKPSQTAVNQSGHVYQSLIQDKRYISKVLKASGIFRETSIKPTNPISPVIFHVLEEMEEDDNRKMQRRVIFDTVNEILVRKISAFAWKRTGPRGFMRELYLEMDRLCGMACGNLDDEDDGSIRLLNADMKYGSDDWTDNRDEVPANALEIERLIFKDLINEVVNGQIEAHLLRH